MIILNSPHNPTGGTLSKTELKAVADAANERGIWVLSDEVYGRLTYGEPHESVLSFDGMRARTIMVDGASKAYAMTGWRLGWAVLPPTLKTAFDAVDRQFQLMRSAVHAAGRRRRPERTPRLRPAHAARICQTAQDRC